ncbi:MAG TPA: hypothetical protein PLF32_00605 [Bacteroidales bacterium]|jgi:hypothetical protein|nr:hypothetical protein [Bacteroidales bacterium]HON20747.1 hypothetical protein [Bacteroidales bacterium]HOR81140.1 hypothetical protein [Bacteroidales bacterium]HPJ90738.1 hypothetical protein [Bacteroidales bacterium]HPX60058.1 hypothetical protein [Bacteroidales bacterium]
MDTLIKKITNIALIVVSIAATLAALIYNMLDNESAMNWSFYILYAMIIAVVLVLVFFAIIEVFSSKKQILKTLLLLGIAAVVVIIAYIIAPSDLSDVAIRLEVTSSVYKWIGTSINVVYFVFLGVVAALLGSVIYLKIKK